MGEIRIGTRGCRGLPIVESTLAARSNRGRVDGRPSKVHLSNIFPRPGGPSGVGIIARARPPTAILTTSDVTDTGNGQGVLTGIRVRVCTLSDIT